MPTTVDLPESLYRRVESVATERGLSVGEYVTRLVEQDLPVPNAGKAEYGRKEPIPDLFPSAGKDIPILTHAEAFAILDKEEGR